MRGEWVATKYESLLTNLERHHFFPWVMASGCCSHEIFNAGAATYDWQRLAVDDVAADVTEANLLVLAGWINEKRAHELRQTYEMMRKPTYVVVVGVCSISGSPYKLGLEEHERLIRAEDVVPVDVSVGGCPPRPEAIISAILELKRKLNPGPTAEQVLYQALKG